jgi:hypothetical protein
VNVPTIADNFFSLFKKESFSVYFISFLFSSENEIENSSLITISNSNDEEKFLSSGE